MVIVDTDNQWSSSTQINRPANMRCQPGPLGSEVLIACRRSDRSWEIEFGGRPPATGIDDQYHDREADRGRSVNMLPPGTIRDERGLVAASGRGTSRLWFGSVFTGSTGKSFPLGSALDELGADGRQHTLGDNLAPERRDFPFI